MHARNLSYPPRPPPQQRSCRNPIDTNGVRHFIDCSPPNKSSRTCYSATCSPCGVPEPTSELSSAAGPSGRTVDGNSSWRPSSLLLGLARASSSRPPPFPSDSGPPPSSRSLISPSKLEPPSRGLSHDSTTSTSGSCVPASSSPIMPML